MNPFQKLENLGQSVWLDFIRRSLMTSGELEQLISEDCLRGVTSNPAIFEKAITGSNDYSETLQALWEKHTDAMKSYEEIAIRDIQDAADILDPVYQRTKRRDGYVSMEVSPYLARDTEGTVREARRLWQTLDRNNVMIKVPATPEGIPAIEKLISDGINVNVTLIFSRRIHEQVVEAYLVGLETLASKGGSLFQVASVASFFVSRIDSQVDAALKAIQKGAASPSERKLIDSILGRVAIANAKLAYQLYKKKFSGQRWEKLAAVDAQTQRVLWASTGTKNPNYRDTLYIEELIGSDTVNTVPPSTFEAFRDHGKVRPSLEEGVTEALQIMETLEKLEVSLDEVTDQLLGQGLLQFSQAFDKLLAAVDTRCRYAPSMKVSSQTTSLPKKLASAADAVLEDWTANGKVRRLWARDASLWTGADESHWLGWLGITEDQGDHIQELTDLAGEVKKNGFAQVVLLGMGGSSLCPDLLQSSFGKVESFPELLVLDSTDPQQIISIKDKIDPERTLFIVSSKSGSTLEPNIFKRYFFELVKEVTGEEKVGSRFMAVTDPGSSLQQVAEADEFRDIYFGLPSIGGRYSALSNFGMVPAAIMGIDTAKLVDRADEMAVACSSCVPVKENPGVVLGAVLGLCGRSGRDKITLVASPQIHNLGAWLEQLLAESTGKMGKGLIPVAGEKLGPPEVYGGDRLFVYIRFESAPDPVQDQAVSALEKAGHPVIRIALEDLYDLGREFFRWEIATAVAGSIMGLNPFDQPDVEASKVATHSLTTEYEKTGSLPPEEPFFEESGIKLFAHQRDIKILEENAGKNRSFSAFLGVHLAQLKPNDYFALLAYLEMNQAHERQLQEVRRAVRDRYRVATCLGFGPRFLHSTGQAYKGGPNTGVFVQITCDDASDIKVTGHKYTFGTVKAAQARGDFQVLIERKRRALRIHLPSDLETGLGRLKETFERTLRR